MPFGDGTGPRGLGPMTGRGTGYCAGFGRPGFANPVPRRKWFVSGMPFGMGPAGWTYAYNYPYRGLPYNAWGRGRGRGFGWRSYVPCYCP